MSSFKLSIDEDILLIRTSASILNFLLFFKHWSYQIELPVNRIKCVEVERRAGILTLMITKESKDGHEKHIAVSLLKASNKQVSFIRNALPKIIEERPQMHEISIYLKQYLK